MYSVHIVCKVSEMGIKRFSKHYMYKLDSSGLSWWFSSNLAPNTPLLSSMDKFVDIKIIHYYLLHFGRGFLQTFGFWDRKEQLKNATFPLHYGREIFTDMTSSPITLDKQYTYLFDTRIVLRQCLPAKAPGAPGGSWWLQCWHWESLAPLQQSYAVTAQAQADV